MDQTDTTLPDSSTEGEIQEEELSHSDKMIGVITEPKITFEKTSLFPPKTIDWLLPVFLLLLMIAVTNTIMMNNPEIRLQVKEKQTAQFDKAVQEGQMTREQADQQIERMDQMGGLMVVFSIIGIFIGGFIFFFIMTAIYFFFAKVVFKDNGIYKSALAANGLTAYIVIIQIIIAAIIAFALGRLINDTSAAALVNADRSTITGFLLAKIDPITIWAYIVLSIGLAKMFKAQSLGKYCALVFGIWLIGGLILFFISQSVPFLQNFA